MINKHNGNRDNNTKTSDEHEYETSHDTRTHSNEDNDDEDDDHDMHIYIYIYIYIYLSTYMHILKCALQHVMRRCHALDFMGWDCMPAEHGILQTLHVHATCECACVNVCIRVYCCCLSAPLHDVLMLV